MRTFSASFHGLLGDEASFRADEERALSSGVNPFSNILATVHAKRGDTERAIELLRSSLRQGQATNYWRVDFQPLGGLPLESESFRAFLKEFEEERERLLAIY